MLTADSWPVLTMHKQVPLKSSRKCYIWNYWILLLGGACATIVRKSHH